MAAEDQGIMSLPQGAQSAPPELTLEDSHDAVMQGLQNASPQAATDVQQLVQSILPQLDQLSDEELDMVLQAIQYLYEGGEKEYATRLQEIISSGLLDAGDLPNDFDPEILSAIGTVLLQAKQQRQMGNQREQALQPPAQFARGGIAEAARLVASKGRTGDTMLAHINADEARLLRKRGGMGTINPATGLPEYGLWKSIKKAVKSVGNAVKSVVKSVVNTVKKVVQSPIGKILATVALATFLGPGAFGIKGLGLAASTSLGLASAGTTLLAGGNLKQALISGATAFFGAPGGTVSQLVGQAGITNLAANAALSAGIVGTGAGLLSGQKLQEAVKSGLTAGAISGLATGLQQGFTTQPGTTAADLAQAPVPGKEGTFTVAGDQAAGPVTPQQVQSQIAQGPAATAQPLGPEFDKFLAPGQAQPYTQALADTVAREPYSQALANTPARMPGGAPTPSGTDPLGDFIASRGIGATPTTAPTIGQSVSRIGGGIADLAQGNFQQGWEDLKGGAADLFSPKTYTPAQLRTSNEYLAARAAGATDAAALAEAGKTLNPGLMRSYAPMVAAGLGVSGLMGGFKQGEVRPSQMLLDFEKRDQRWGDVESTPSQYYPQNLPGVRYDDRGAIIGSVPWSPTATMEDVRVPAVQNPPLAMNMGTMYTPAPGALGQAPQIFQPYNTSSMYSNLMNPRQTGYGQNYFAAAQGGIASLAKGGYPRRTGQISGPGTETSDSIPAMLSDGEFVMTAKAVRGAGNGSRRAGAKKMYALMHQLERNASRG